MEVLVREDWKPLRDWLVPERPCSLIAWHVLTSGIGRIWVDSASNPRCAAAFAGGNLTFAGEASALNADGFAAVIDVLLGDWDRVFIAAPDAFLPAMSEALGATPRWPRVIYTAQGPLRPDVGPPPGEIRRLGVSDAAALESLDEDIQWISDTFGGPGALAATDSAFGGFVADRLVSVATPFYLGERYEEIGVVTEEDQRGAGWSLACSAKLILDMDSRGRIPCWSTTPDNTPSRRVAERLGFCQTREETHFMAGDPTEGVLPPE